MSQTIPKDPHAREAMVLAETIEGLPECPHCGRARPGTVHLQRHPIHDGVRGLDTNDYVVWAMYRCTSCHHVILVESKPVRAGAEKGRCPVKRVFPDLSTVSEAIPPQARRYLGDAQKSMHAPSASILSSNSAIDAMLKQVGFPRFDADGKERSLYARIEEAANKGTLTKGMAEWAHVVRLDANDQRHADDGLASFSDDELRTIAHGTHKLAKAIAEFLFVIPAIVDAGKKDAGTK